MRNDGFSAGKVKTKLRIPILAGAIATLLLWLPFIFYYRYLDHYLMIWKLVPIGFVWIGLMICCLDSHLTITFGTVGIKVADGTDDIYRCGDLIHLAYFAEEGLSLATRDGREYCNKTAIFDPLADKLLRQLFPKLWLGRMKWSQNRYKISFK